VGDVECAYVSWVGSLVGVEWLGVVMFFKSSNNVDLLVSGFGQIYLTVKYI
jgi:hypothetical protein